MLKPLYHHFLLLRISNTLTKKTEVQKYKLFDDLRKVEDQIQKFEIATGKEGTEYNKKIYGLRYKRRNGLKDINESSSTEGQEEYYLQYEEEQLRKENLEKAKRSNKQKRL